MVLVDLRDHLIRCSDVTWVERSERTMFPSTLTYFTLFVHLSLYLSGFLPLFFSSGCKGE